MRLRAFTALLFAHSLTSCVFWKCGARRCASRAPLRALAALIAQKTCGTQKVEWAAGATGCEHASLSLV